MPRSSSLHAISHLPPAHHETSKRDSPNERKIKEKQNKTITDSNSNLAKSMTHHNQTKPSNDPFGLSYCRGFVVFCNHNRAPKSSNQVAASGEGLLCVRSKIPLGAIAAGVPCK
jgi:hypothetical protein